MTVLPRLNVSRGDYGEHESPIVKYRKEGTRRALELDNRGPLTLNSDGHVDPSILDAYREYGFYVLQGVLEPDELHDIEMDIAEILDRAPVHRSAKEDKHGRKALGVDHQARNLVFVKPLSDPIGGTSASYGRHPAKMIELNPTRGFT